jgi:type VI secretion system secreted protein VgrG
MINTIIADVNIADKLLPYTSVTLSQKMNEHHEFTIRVDHHVLEAQGTLSLDNTKDLIGKYVVISLFNVVGSTLTRKWDFKGIICEVAARSNTAFEGDLILKGYSPTILMEDGPGYASYNEKTLSEMVTKATKNFEQSECPVNSNPSLTSPIKYVSRYKESNFHFLNRLSNDYGELFYYDGTGLVFGSPSTTEFVEIISGVDLSNMQLNMKVSPIEAWGFAYASKGDQYITTKGPDIDGLDPYPKHAVDVSNTLYGELDDVPIYQPVESTNEAENFVKKSKESTAAGLVVLSGTTTNPDLFLGRVADVKVSRSEGDVPVRDDYGAYLVTSITHQFTQAGAYYNQFEALSGWVRGIPVRHIVNPMAEPQYAWIHDNKDPQKMGRVQVKMQWQTDDEHTDWIWVMTPDAGGGKDGAKGGGFVVMPEKNDRVLVGFVYNNPDRPFVMGSLFHGKTAPDGGLRCLTARKTSAKVCINDGDGSITIEDGGGHKIVLDGAGNIDVTSDTKISLKVGSSEIKIEPSKITIKATDVKIDASTADIQGSSKAVLKKDDSTFFKAEGSKVAMEATSAEVKGVSDAKLTGVNATVNGTAKAEVKGAQVSIN